jgi:hypothetical protein
MCRCKSTGNRRPRQNWLGKCSEYTQEWPVFRAVLDVQSTVNETNPRAEQKTAYAIVLTFGLGFSFCIAASRLSTSFWLFIGTAGFGLGLLLALVASFFMGLKHWRAAFLSWLGPVVLSAGFILLFPIDLWAGSGISDLTWKFRQPTYEAVVKQIRDGTISAPQSMSLIALKTLPPGAEDILAAREPDGSVVVVFVTGTGFPLYHRGYVFDGSGTNQDCRAQFKTFSNKVGLRKETDGWFYFSD